MRTRAAMGAFRADLHFLYNLMETVPLVAGFLQQFKRSYEEAPASTGEHAIRDLAALTIAD